MPPIPPHALRPRCMLRPVPRRAPRVLGCLEVAEPLHGWTHTHIGSNTQGDVHPLRGRRVGSGVMWASVQSGAGTGAGRPERLPHTPFQMRLVSSAHMAAHLGAQIRKRPPAGVQGPSPRSPGAQHPAAWRVATLTVHRVGKGESLGGLDASLAPEPRPGCQGWTGRRGGPPPSQPREMRPLRLRLACLLPVRICPWALLTSSV